MNKSLLTLLTFSLLLTACGQRKNNSEIKELTIDPNIKFEVEKYITNAKELDVFKDEMQVYLNSGFVESYENDSLVFNSNFKENKAPFKSFYVWKGDTLKIDGAFGLFGGTGFDIEIHEKSATLRHLLGSDESPSYAYKEKDSLIFRLEVPCNETKIILSAIPDSTKNQIIYGYVEFKSLSFYASSGSSDGQEILPRQKLRNNMKVYFKSSRLHL